MGRVRTRSMGRDKEIVPCGSCSGKGCSNCNNCGHLEVIEELLRGEYYGDNGKRDTRGDVTTKG